MQYPLISCIQKLMLYETKARYYVVGSNHTETEFRVLKIDRTEPRELHIQDDKHTYSETEIKNLLTMLESGNRTTSRQKVQAGVTKKVAAYGIVGFVRFLEGYYIILITERKKVALIGNHAIYKVADTVMQYIPNNGQRYTHPDEAKYVKMFQSVDLSSNFYFSYSYDITHTLQYNMNPIGNPSPGGHGEPGKPPDDTGQSTRSAQVNGSTGDVSVENNNFDHHIDHQGDRVLGVRTKPAEKFLWNKHLLKLFQDEVHHDWLLYIIYGFIAQSNLCIYGKSIFITLVTRRSNEFAGTRFLKRGANCQGAVANEVETEQIVCDASVTQLHKAKVSSFVQMRGSIPLFWSQDISKMVPRPQISIDQRDPYFHAAGLHFNQCLKRYGAPILLLNLIKRRERHTHESILCDEFKHCKEFLNQFLPPEKHILYIGFDMAHYTKKSKTSDVLERLARISSKCVMNTGFFFHAPNLKEDFWTQDQFDGVQGWKTSTGLRQTGLVRTNCVDCLDRTNTAQFAIGKCALAYQLCALGVLGSLELDFDTDCLKILEELYEDQGDTVALQYGGSQLVHRIEGYRKISPWASHSRDIYQTLSRYFSNTFSDVEKQQATNVFLGLFEPRDKQPNIWDLPTDFYLHNKDCVIHKIPRRSYTNWCESGVFDCLPLPYEEENKAADVQALEERTMEDERVDSFFDFYKPYLLTELDKLYTFSMTHSIRNFMPKNAKAYSPFVRRAAPLYKEIFNKESRAALFAKSVPLTKTVVLTRSVARSVLLESDSLEANPNISGKDSTSSVQSNTSEEGSSSSASSVEGDFDVTSSESELDLDQEGSLDGDPFNLDQNVYGLDLKQYEDDVDTQEIYTRYEKLGQLCLEPEPVDINKGPVTLTEPLVVEPLGEYKSDIYSVEEPSVSRRSLELYQRYVKCGRDGATAPPDTNKAAYRNYVKQMYRLTEIVLPFATDKQRMYNGSHTVKTAVERSLSPY